MSEHVDWYNRIAVERGVPDGWRWFSAEWKGGGAHSVMLIKGGIPTLYTRGSNKGKPNPKRYREVRELVVTQSDIDAAHAKWEAETGKCHQCYGVGQRVTGWCKERGETKRDCKRCNATGAAP